MPYMIGGKNIRDLAELGATNDPREATGFTTSKYLYHGYTHQDWYGTRMFINYSGYIYSNEMGIQTKYQRGGSTYFSVAAKGCRPYTRKKWDTSTPGTYYVNKFDDGEVWVSTSTNSRSGTRISTAAENINYVFTMMISPGGGGGGSSGTVSSGGGGGGSFLFLCHKLVPNWIYRLYIGSGGSGGGGNTDGNSGGQCQAAMFTSTNWSTSGVTSINIFGGGYGKSGGNGGGGGSGGGTSTDGNTSNSYMHVIEQYAGMSGGSKGSNGSSSPEKNTIAYNPEGARLNFGLGQGGGGNYGGGGGSGWYFGHAGGKGGAAYEDGGSGGIGAGGGGAAFVLFSSRSGGKGGDGYAALFY